MSVFISWSARVLTLTARQVFIGARIRGEANDHAYDDEVLSEVPRDDRRRWDHQCVGEGGLTLDALTGNGTPITASLTVGNAAPVVLSIQRRTALSHGTWAAKMAADHDPTIRTRKISKGESIGTSLGENMFASSWVTLLSLRERQLRR